MRSIRLEVRTRRASELFELTSLVRQAVREVGLRDGAVLVYSPHTTAGVTIQENADPEVARDLLHALENAFPDAPPWGRWQHAEGNSPAHAKTAFTGCSQLVPVESGELVLGTWQGVFLCEFDGPRTREVVLRFLADAA
ncbi:MAG TPA: secondary thiamine-phosphate synthase enzyme YjbQ [Anaeromyxobacteraceae bacterium]|nr:secondary thiamine-phosphate synthase enzyme YjbQ [Anaeromyxobacteraceae bacterium]